MTGGRAIEAAADGSSDVIGMAYWWSNCIQLRWMLWAMCHGGDQPDDGSMAEDSEGMDEFDWVMKVSASTFPFRYSFPSSFCILTSPTLLPLDALQVRLYISQYAHKCMYVCLRMYTYLRP